MRGCSLFLTERFLCQYPARKHLKTKERVTMKLKFKNSLWCHMCVIHHEIWTRNKEQEDLHSSAVLCGRRADPPSCLVYLCMLHPYYNLSRVSVLRLHVILILIASVFVRESFTARNLKMTIPNTIMCSFDGDDSWMEESGLNRAHTFPRRYYLFGQDYKGNMLG